MKIGFFITARLKSTRLKNKLLLDLKGKPVIQRVIDRCKKVIGIDGIVLCTSTNPQDSILYDFAQKNKIQFYAGHEDDVLKRLCDAAKYFGYDAFLSITADNPLFSFRMAQQLLGIYKSNSHDFLYSDGLPIGMNVFFFNLKTLEIINKFKAETDTEIWYDYVMNSDIFSIGKVNALNIPIDAAKRITLDYSEDYRLIHAIYNNIDTETPSLEEIIHILVEYGELLKINEKKEQKWLSKENSARIKNFFLANKDAIDNFASTIGKELKPGFKEYNIEF